MAKRMKVLMITSEWPSPEKPFNVPFIVQQAEFIKKAGVDLMLFHFRGGKNPVRYLRAWREAQRLISAGHFDLVHAQWGQSGLLALPRRVPLVVTFRGDDLEGIIGASGRPTLQGWVLKNISRMVARLADQVIVVSESLACRIPRRPYHVVPSGLNLELFCPIPKNEARQQLHLSPGKRYLLFAGAAENPRKRVALARQVVRRLCAEMDVELLVASGISHQQMPIYMSAADALLLVSLHEGSPNVVKEALACNLPVVSVDVGDVRQRIASIEGCHILADDHIETIASALREVLSRQTPINSRPSVLDLDENQLSRKVISIYQQALQAPQPRSRG